MKCRVNLCLYPASNLCDGCGLTSYCSIGCQKTDWHIHRQICHPLLNIRLKKICEVAIKYRVDSGWLNLSKHITITDDTKPGSIYHSINAFNTMGDETRCVVCTKDIGKGSLYNHLKTYIIFHGRVIAYYRCRLCYNENKLLCSDTFLEVGICRVIRENGFIHLLMCKAYIIQELDADIVSYILNILSYLFRCEGCKIKI